MNANRLLQIRDGNGCQLYHGIFAFTTSSTTKDVDVPFGRVLSVSPTPIGAPAATEAQLSVDETVSGTVGTGDAAIVGANGSTTLTVTRPAGTTSGLKFSLIVLGY